ncbi:GNAT family N-acetyltransferase, partial [Loigolactobacillus coryniformis]|uniref:GNAT family N-acetyltransferase n=1 Tax=Loigolactobacillus coryniformis TaxID=1610 RepID=UPI00201B2BD2
PLPTSEYELYEDNILIGKIQIRHKPSHAPEIPENMESHIYYEIIPVHRTKGYGKTILKLGIEKAKELGLREIFITCMENNTSSKKIIES